MPALPTREPSQPEAQLSSIKGKVDALLRMWEHLKRGDEVPDKVMVRDLNVCAIMDPRTNLDEATSVARNESRGERCRGCLCSAYEQTGCSKKDLSKGVAGGRVRRGASAMGAENAAAPSFVPVVAANQGPDT